MSTLYISPTKSGTGDGSSWANAAGLSDLSNLIAQAGADGTVLLRADQGAYDTTSEIAITHGGTNGHPVTIMGVDGAGNPMRAEIIGTRDEVVTTTSAPGSEVFRLLDGANNLSFENLSFLNQGNGCIRIGADISNLTIQHVDAHNVMRFIENYASGTRTSATVDGLVVRDVDVTGFSRGVIRLSYDSHNIVLEDMTGDSERQNGDSWATGVALEGTVHHVTIRDVAMSNSFDNSTPYWNGDGFATEAQTYDIIFENTFASDNTDGGYDIKSNNVTMINAVAEGNKRNFRFWGDNVTVIDSTSIDPHTQGGTGEQAHVWLGNGASVTIIGSKITDFDPNMLAFDLAEGNATLNLQEMTVSLNPAAQYVRYGSNSVLNEIVGPTPGPDLLESSITFSLSGHTAHNLTLTGSGNVDGFGNDLANVITGNTGDNVLQGGAGNDVLLGGTGADSISGGTGNDSLDGGDGNDTLDGGAGNDIYVVDSLADQIIEGSGGGTDEIRSTIALTKATAYVENYTFLGTTAVNFIGNSSPNKITGTAAADTLNGAGGDDTLIGGAGADVLRGGAGNDTYFVDIATDKVIDAVGAGTDTVYSTAASNALATNVENLVLLTGAANGNGNSLANVITGNDAANTLGGKDGADRIDGGAGADTLIGDNGNDYLDGGADAAADSLSGAKDNDTMIIRTLDKADGGSGDDVLVLFDHSGFGTISGGTNTSNDLSGTTLGDTLAFDGTLDLTPAAQIAKVSNIETISMVDGIGGAGTDALTLNAPDVINLGTGIFDPKFSGTDNYSSKDAIRTTGDAGDALHLVQTASGGPDHWHQVTTATNVPAGYTLWVHETTASSTGASEDAYVLVQNAVAVSTS